MRKSLLLVSLCVILSLSNVYAQSVSPDRAEKIAYLFMKESTSIGEERAAVNAVHSHTINSNRGIACMYVFNIEGGGFVVVSADDRVKPVLAYSTKGSFDASEVAAGFNFTLSSYKDEIEYVRDNEIAATQDIIDEWTMVEKSGRIVKDRDGGTVGPIVETTWNQNYPYNYLCPEDEAGPGGRVYAGCVATAMSQVMRYWNHPVVGSGSHSYTPDDYWSGVTYPTQTANFGETYYNFEKMPLYLDSLSTEEEIFYIAQLQWHCGIAVDMMYGNNGSGAYSEDVPYAINHYFGYNYGSMIYQWDYSNAEWAEALKAELDQNRPLYYSGQDDYGNGGHAFVCDGYDENNFFHYNWGWGGRDDAFCAIGALNTTKYSFNSWNSAIFDFYPVTDDYFNRPEKVQDMEITELPDNSGVTVSWTNPSLTVEGESLGSLDTVFLRRDFVTIAVFTDVNPGESMSYVDNVEEGMYDYSIYVKNETGNSSAVYQSYLIGEKCDMIFEMSDAGGDGWKGGSISVFKNDERIAVITMEDGSELTETVPLLKGELTFVWNKCWYKDEYYTCDEVSFVIKDADGNVIHEEAEDIEPGVMFEYINDCSVCAAPYNFDGEYHWESGEYAALLSWTLNYSSDLTQFNVYRSVDNVDYELVAEIQADPAASEYEYFDEVEAGAYYYKVKAVHEMDGEPCESEAALTESGEDYVFIEVTSLNEIDEKVRIYPNPTNGNVFIEMENIKTVTVYDIIGQELITEYVDNDNCNIDMSVFEDGIYFVKIHTEYGSLTRKLILAH